MCLGARKLGALPYQLSINHLSTLSDVTAAGARHEQFD